MVFFIASVNVLGLVTVSQFLNSILGYIPNVISACLVLTAGVLIGGWVESAVKGSLGVTSLATGRLMGKIAGYTVVIFTILAAISELGIAERFVSILFIGFVAMLSIGFGLAFGLGAKDIVAKILGEWYKNVTKHSK
jgi:small-conductance mechanosensitive channel